MTPNRVLDIGDISYLMLDKILFFLLPSLVVFFSESALWVSNTVDLVKPTSYMCKLLIEV